MKFKDFLDPSYNDNQDEIKQNKIKQNYLKQIFKNKRKHQIMRLSGRPKLHLTSSNNVSFQNTVEQLDDQQRQMVEIKSRQLLSTIMDTIEEKRTNNDDLKQSMKNFDKQLMKMYSSSVNNTINDDNYQHQLQNELYQTINHKKFSNNYQNQQKEMMSTINYREKRHFSMERNQPDKLEKHTKYDTIDINRTITKNMISRGGENYNVFQEVSKNKKNNIKNNFMSTKQLIMPSNSVYKLQVPKPNSLTDQFMQLVLGSQQKQFSINQHHRLIQEYDRAVNPQKYELQRKQQMIEKVKKQWLKNQSPQHTFNYQNNYHQINNDPFQRGQPLINNQSKAFYDEDYYNYLKTNMKYLTQMQKPTNSQLNTGKMGHFLKLGSNQAQSIMKQFNNVVGYPSPLSFGQQLQQQKQFCEPQYDESYGYKNIQFPQRDNTPLLPCDPHRIINKLKETGGIQNTIKKMEKSLKKNQLKNLTQNQYLTSNNKLVLISKPKKIENNQQLINTKLNYNSNSRQHNFATPKSLNSSFINKNEQQIGKISHNYNQFSQNKNNKIKNTIINRNVQIQQRNKSSWRQRSQSMRNKISQTLQKNQFNL